MTKLQEHIEIASSAYHVLTDCFQRHADEVLEIEVLPSAILPPEGQMILEDRSCIGIPKKTLAMAFMVAVRRLARHKTTERRLDSLASFPDFVLAATKVILLFDPEHVTAANYRKKYLVHLRDQRAQVSDDSRVATEIFSRSVREEFLFLDSVLTSPLHRQTKSPTLWNHRRWLYSMCFEEEDRADLPMMEGLLPITALRSELEIVMKSSEKHPMNYYAWQYARHFLRLIHIHCSFMMEYTRSSLLQRVIPFVLDWCIRHPRDTSGFSFLLSLISDTDCDRQQAGEVVTKVLSLTQSFKWEYESIKSFLQTAANTDGLLSTLLRKKIPETVNACIISPQTNSFISQSTASDTPTDQENFIRTSKRKRGLDSP